MMRVLGATKFGPPSDVLTFSSQSEPSLGDSNHDVLIRVAYAELNPVDKHKLNARAAGEDVPSDKSPLIVGYGGSGVVREDASDADQAHQAKRQKQPAEDDDDEGGTTLTLVGKRVAFLCDARRNGSYAELVTVDRRLVAVIPEDVTDAEAASAPLAGLTAFEALEKAGMSPLEGGRTSEHEASKKTPARRRTLLIVGGAGGVGSWTTLLARDTFGTDVEIVCTASTVESKAWCVRMGADRAIGHDEIGSELKGGPGGSVDSIVCLAEPTPKLFGMLTEVLRPYGKICLAVAGDGIKGLDMGFVFFKSGTLSTVTVFTGSRSGFQRDQARHLEHVLKVIHRRKSTNQTFAAPLMEGWESVPGTQDWTHVLDKGGAIEIATSGHCRGKLVMKIV